MIHFVCTNARCGIQWHVDAPISRCLWCFGKLRAPNVAMHGDKHRAGYCEAGS